MKGQFYLTHVSVASLQGMNRSFFCRHKKRSQILHWAYFVIAF
ncbi:hypothetical protein [Tumidithrix elongata]